MKLHWYSIILLLFLNFTSTAISQNLVINPSFEDHTHCPVSTWDYEFVKDWIFMSGTCLSYLHLCANNDEAGVPYNWLGFQNANSGVAYMCLMAKSWDFDPDRRGYITGIFSTNLLKDSIYCIRYYVNLCDVSNGAIQNVDAYIHDTLLVGNVIGTVNNLTNFDPQIKSSHILSDTANWEEISGLYKAKGGERYISIGNFNSDANTTMVNFGDGATRIDYYIDDVSVTFVGGKAPALGPDTILCRSQMPYRLSAPDGYDSYLWSTGQTTQNIDVYNQGEYTLTCFLGACGSLSDEIVITFDTPLLSLIDEKTICRGDTATISAPSGFAKYRWSNGDTTQILRATQGGTYYLTSTDRCSTQFDSVKVVVDTIPTDIIKLGNDTTLCLNGKDHPVVLSANTELPNYLWSNGDTTKYTTVSTRGVYTLSSQFRCGEVSDEIFVDICPPVIEFPDAFTPNGDGLNDTFGPVQTNMFIQSLHIYNHWGQLVFEGRTPGYHWDGTYNSKPSPSGIYIYRVLYSPYDADGKISLQKGCLMLIR
jgi:gliding motility-associated-like protein